MAKEQTNKKVPKGRPKPNSMKIGISKSPYGKGGKIKK